jgi:hypothetical protein
MFSKIIYLPSQKSTAHNIGCGQERTMGINVFHLMIVHGLAILSPVARTAANWKAVVQAHKSPISKIFCKTRNEMNLRRIETLVVAALFSGGLSLMAEQPLPAPPAGFSMLPQRSSIQAMKSKGVADMSIAERESDSTCENADKITFTYGWQTALGADKSLELMAKAPQDPASEMMGARQEPAGKRRYKNGLLEWKKRTLILATSCPAGFVTYGGTWLGYLSGKLINVSVLNVSSRETGQAWIDEYIDKMVALVSASQ